MIELAQLDTQEYLVEEILSHERTSTGRMKEVDRYEFEVKWVGYKETSMLGYKDLAHLTLFKDYVKGIPSLTRIFKDV
ncbi:hypothetical protein ADUPG1_001478, partial [Aduncisulcus paluster]